MSGVVANIKDGVEEVAIGAARIARKVVVTSALVLATGAVMGVIPSGEAHGQSATPRAVAATPGPTTQRLTDEQCRILMGHLAQHIRVAGRQNLSDDFVNAMIQFVSPNGNKCSAPAAIPASGRDLDVFNSISSIMRQTQRVDLRAMGITTVARTASLQ